MWVKLQLDLFFGKLSRIHLKDDAARKLDLLERRTGNLKSEMLDEAYHDMYECNTEEDTPSRTIATRAYKWMMCAKRNLRLWELANAVSMNDDRTCISVTKENILKICSNFIISNSTGVAQFAHVSVREYLGRQRIDSIQEYLPEQANIQAATTCLAYLSHPQTRMETIAKLKRGIHGYAMMYWASHVASVMPENRSYALQSLYEAFLSEDERGSFIMKWITAICKPSTLRSILPDGTSDYVINCFEEHQHPMIVACIWGLIDVIPPDAMKISSQRLLNDSFRVACEYGHEAAMQLLLDNGANVEYQGKWVEVALLQALKAGREKTVQRLLETGAETKAIDRYGRTVLHNAVYKGSLEMVQLLLKNGAIAETADRSGETALHKAASMGSLEMVQLLLKNGAIAETADRSGQTALHWAVYRGSPEMLQSLLKNGAIIDVVTEWGETALHWAAMIGRLEVVNLLLKNGAIAETADKNGKTALHRAALHGKRDIVGLLLDNGADVWAIDKNRHTVLDMAAGAGHSDIVSLLKQAQEAAERGDDDVSCGRRAWPRKGVVG